MDIQFNLGENKDEIKISVEFAMKELISVMPRHLFRECLKADSEYITIQQSMFDFLLNEKKRLAHEQELLEKTATLNNRGIELEKTRNFEEAIKIYEENIQLGYKASYSFTRLKILYRKRGDYENEKRVLKRYFEVYNLPSAQLLKELEKIDNKAKGVKTTYKLPEKANPVKPQIVSLGAKYLLTIEKLPEFNFYHDKRIGEDTNEYLLRTPMLVNDNVYKPVLWQIQRKFKNHLAKARKYESDYDLKSASDIYELMISEQCYLTEPYDRLQKIYFKAGLMEDCKRVLLQSIAYFSTIRSNQRSYVLKLGEKYGKLDYVNQMLSDNRKLFYYGGAFELYNPYPIIARWENRLSKLCK